jgi:hypothetical protein
MAMSDRRRSGIRWTRTLICTILIILSRILLRRSRAPLTISGMNFCGDWKSKIWDRHNQDGDYNVSGVLQMPISEVLESTKATPNEIFGSDHFSIVSQFSKKLR